MACSSHIAEAPISSMTVIYRRFCS